MKVAMLIGNQPNQIALANKVSKQFEVTGIVVQTKTLKRKKSATDLINKIADKVLFSKISAAWFAMLNFYKKNFPTLPETKILNTEKINTTEVAEFLLSCSADVLMVSGTTMVKAPLLQLYFPKGILNLHTGFSPYVNGGPNCTNWCIANNQPELIGNTIMWIDAGIDSGNIITTEFTSITGSETLNELHIHVMEHAHDLYLRSLICIDKNFSATPNVNQPEIAEGKTFYTRDWNFSAKRNLVRNWRNFSQTVTSQSFKQKQLQYRAIELLS